MRHVKQLIYGVFYLAFWAALVGGIYAWQRPAASCFDNVQDQNEQGIDCGGVCSRVCIPQDIIMIGTTASPQMILLAAASSTGGSTATPPRVSLLAQIQNRNSDFGAASFDYTFTVYDQSGATVATFPGNSFIYPGELKYLAVPNAVLPVGAQPAYVRIDLQDPVWTPAARFPRPQLLIQSASASVANGTLVTQGALVDQDNVDFGAVYLTALFYDQSGAVAGISATELDNVLTGSSRNFTFFHPIITNAALDKTQVFATALNPR